MTILAAVGGEHEQDRVVEVGHDLATAFDVDLHVLHVMAQDQFEEIRGREQITAPVAIAGADEEGLTYVSSDRSVPEYTLEDGDEDAESVARAVVSRTLADEHMGGVTTTGLVGDPATETVAEAERLDARFVVVGGRKQSPARKAIFGSVSQAIIAESDRPVVAITRSE